MEKIGILGIGRLGLCFALNMERVGYNVIGIDIHEEYIAQINQKKVFSPEPLVKEYLTESKKFEASTEIKEIISNEIDTIFVMVATPSLSDGSYDHSQLEKVSDELIGFGIRDRVVDVVIGCTVMPGYSNVLQQKLKKYNYRVSYNPEFIAQGAIIKDQQYPDQLLIGEADVEAGDKIEKILQAICKNKPSVCRMDPLSAEITKLATNCFLTMKISFANAIGDLAVKTGADTNKILQAVGADSRIGNKYLNHGFGFGGPCFPRDNRALGKFAKDAGYNLLLSEATDLVNEAHLEFQFAEIMAKEEDTVYFDYVTYKKDTDIIEESQQLKLAVRLAKAGKKVVIRNHALVSDRLRQIYGDIFIFE